MHNIKTNKSQIKIVGITCRTNNMAEMNPATAQIGATIQRYFQGQFSEKTPNRMNPGKLFCVYTEYESDHTGDYTYVIGEEVSSCDGIPAELSSATIPAQNYVKFTTEPGVMPLVCIDAWQKIWALSSEQLGGTRAYRADFEYYDERAQDLQNAVLDIYIGIDG